LSFGLAEAASLLAVLTRQNIPVPEALELCASGVRHASVRAMTQRWAVATAGGQSLAQAMANEWRVPSSVIPLMSWGERAGVLPEAFEIVRTWYLQQIYARVSMLRMLLPPALFLAIGCFVMLVTGALFMPLAALLQGLT
ncbi:MAG: type II secretion system F family protein, partial [Pirellulaceae bacterium]